MEKDNLYLPIYLNQRIVFDLLAILEDGFSQMKKVSTSEKIDKSTATGVEGEIGFNNIFAFLQTKINPSLNHNTSKGSSHDESEDRIHTPNSLFSKLYQILDENKKIKVVEGEYDSSSLIEGEFIEIEGKLLKNPLISLLDSFKALMELAIAFDDTNEGKKNSNKKNKVNNTITRQINFLSNHLKNGDMFDLICRVNQSNLNVVLPVYIEYFNNKNMNEIIDGNYKVLGKITNIIKSKEDEGINLLRNTSLSLMKESLLKQVMTSLTESPDFNIDSSNVNTVIGYPALQIIPIAIYR